jgi:hypothetical protein
VKLINAPCRGRRPHFADEIQPWHDQRRQPARNAADGCHTRVTQAQQTGRRNGERNRDGRCRHARQESLQAEDQHEQQHGERECHNGEGRELASDRGEVIEESGLLDVNAEQLRDLVHHDHQPDAGFESGEHRLGDEIGDETESQHCGRHECHAHEHRERRARNDQRARVPIRHGPAEFGSREDRDRRRRAHAQGTRRAEQRVDHHRHDRGVQADLQRQARDRGVGHRFGNNHRGRRQAGNGVGSKPLALVMSQPGDAADEAGGRHAFSAGSLSSSQSYCGWTAG